MTVDRPGNAQAPRTPEQRGTDDGSRTTERPGRAQAPGAAERVGSVEGSRTGGRPGSAQASWAAERLGGEERLVALRGATTVDADTSDAVTERTGELLTALLERNDVHRDQLVSIIFTSTKDLHSAFPAVAARALGLGDVPLLCASELDVTGGNPNTIRVLIHCYSTRPRASLRHVYLHHAKHLRDDLPE